MEEGKEPLKYWKNVKGKYRHFRGSIINVIGNGMFLSDLSDPQANFEFCVIYTVEENNKKEDDSPDFYIITQEDFEAWVMPVNDEGPAIQLIKNHGLDEETLLADGFVRRYQKME